jgi:hypothetical protein
VPACGYTLSIITSGYPPVLQVTQGTSVSFSLFSRDITDCSVSTVFISTSIVAYPYAVISPNIQSFTLSIVDPCPFSVITGPTSVTNMVAFVGYSETTALSYVFNDTVSQSLTLTTDSKDFCGQKEL